MRISGTLIFLFFGYCLQAQEVTGIWRGHFRSNTPYYKIAGYDDRYKMEVQIASKLNGFEAVTYSYKSTVFYGKATADGMVDAKNKKVLLRELKIVEVRMMSGVACIMTCNLQYVILGGEEFLEGTYTSKSLPDSADCGKGTIFLHKVPTSDFYKEPFVEKREEELATKKATPPPPAKHNRTDSHTVRPAPMVAAKKVTPKKTVNTAAKTGVATAAPKPKTTKPASPKVPEPALAKTNTSQHTVQSMKKDSIVTIDKKPILIPLPHELAARSNELVKTLSLNSREVQLNIYDDGAIDNDTVSVYFDRKLILSHARLTAQAIVLKVHLDESSDTHELVMVAENLGEIPPNTSLMVVRAGEKHFEVRIVSTEQKNAVVVFRYEKPE